MPAKKKPSKAPPKPRVPAKSRADASASRPEPKTKTGRVTNTTLSAQLSDVSSKVDRLEGALAPRGRSADVSAEEHALLNLVDTIVERRSGAMLLPLARLAQSLDRARDAAGDTEQDNLLSGAVSELSTILDGLGVESIEPSRGDDVEPMTHQIVDEVPDDSLEEGLVTAIARRGYRVRGGPVLVPALVSISTGRRQS